MAKEVPTSGEEEEDGGAMGDKTRLQFPVLRRTRDLFGQSSLLVLFVLCELSGAGQAVSNYSARSGNGSHPIKPGLVIHLFPRYGYLSLSMRVVPRNDSTSWIFLEPSKEIFVGSSVQVQEESYSTQDNLLPIQNEFHIDLCEDTNQLVQAYFRRFVIEGLEKPWHAFAGGWRVQSLAKYFGIETSYARGDYRYMLVRVMMVRNAGRMTPFSNATATQAVMDKVNEFQAKDYTSSFKFFNDVGTHYVSSYIAGNSIFQVFVYDQQGFDAVKRRLSESGWARSSYMNQLPFLLPLWTKHMGKVMVLNGDQRSVGSIRESLTVRFLFSSYPNIFKMHDNAELVKKIEKYLKEEDDGILGVELKTLDLLFRDNNKRYWFKESLLQTMHLWEVNL